MIRLTDAQQRIAYMVARGLSNKHIARLTGNTEGTIKSHVSAAIDRLNLANRVQLAVWYTRWEMEQEVERKPWHNMSPAERDEHLRAQGF